MTNFSDKDPIERSVAAFLGSRGFQTAQINSPEELILFAALIFELPEGLTMMETQEQIATLSKKERATRATRNVRIVADNTVRSPEKVARGRIAITEREIMDARTERGGWTKETLKTWGVSFPPPKGWKVKILEIGVPKRTTNKPKKFNQFGTLSPASPVRSVPKEEWAKYEG